MPRKNRQKAEADIYHVMMRGEGRQIIFESNDDRLCFLRMLARAQEKCGAHVYAWCLMDNHVHMLLKVPFSRLAKLMQILMSGYATYYNSIHDHVGHLFAGRYKSEPIDSDEYLMTVVRYIHQNPVKGGMSASCDYRWSSYQSYISGTGKTNTEFVLAVFGGLDEFVAFHEHDSRGRPLHELAMAGGVVPFKDEKAYAVAAEALDGMRLSDVKALGREERDEALMRLRTAGLTVRQIERLTGIGRGVINRAQNASSANRSSLSHLESGEIEKRTL